MKTAASFNDRLFFTKVESVHRSRSSISRSRIVVVHRKEAKNCSQTSAPVVRTTPSLLLVSSGVVRSCIRETLMEKLKKRIMKWSLSAVKMSLAAAVLATPALPVLADDEDSHDYGARAEERLKRSSMHWFGIRGPLEASAPATTGAYRTATQRADDQVLVADSLKVEYVTRNAGNLADMFAFWPNDRTPSHLIFCIEGAREDLGTFLSGGLVKKFNPAVQRIRLSDGSVETVLRGMSRCDGIRRTPWGTILATEETTDGGAYEILNPIRTTNYTVQDRATGAIIDENGMPSTSEVAKRPALPTMAWEGLAVLRSGVVIAGDELRPGSPADADGGAIFKFVPATPRPVPAAASPAEWDENVFIDSLSQSPLVAGNVYALRMSCTTGVQYGQGCEIGSGAWVAVGATTARGDADRVGATGYYRPEDLEQDDEYKGEGVRFCWTNTGESDIANYGEVLCGIDRAPLVADPNQQTVTANRFVEGDADFNQPDNFAFQPKTGIHYVIEDNNNGDIFACLPDGKDRDIKTDGCIKILSVKDSSAEPTGFKFTADGKTAYLAVQHSNDTNMPKVDDYATDDIIKITGFKIPHRFER